MVIYPRKRINVYMLSEKEIPSLEKFFKVLTDNIKEKDKSN